MSLTDPYIKHWNVMEDYENGDIVIKGDQVFVYNHGALNEVAESQDEMELNNVRHAVDAYHKDKGLPSYDEIMRIFYENRPEYLL